MFAKIFALFALAAVALAAPKPAPAPAPQYLAYNAGVDYVYPAAAAPVASVYSPYLTAPAAPLAYSAYPGAAVYVR